MHKKFIDYDCFYITLKTYRYLKLVNLLMLDGILFSSSALLDKFLYIYIYNKNKIIH